VSHGTGDDDGSVVLAGFFKIQRGNNFMMLEACPTDCWYGNPTFDMEDEILGGQLAGSMAGLVKQKGTHLDSARAKLRQNNV
jgi:hypothetical protein